MSKDKMAIEQARARLMDMASTDPTVAEAAQRAWAQEVGDVVRKGIFDEDTIAGIFKKEVLGPGVEARYYTDLVKPGEEDNFVAYTYQNQNRIPERRVEADEFTIPTFKIANSIDWDLDIASDARFDMVSRAVDIYKMGFVKKMNYDGWTTLLAAAVERGLYIYASTQAGNPFTGRTHVGTATLGGEFTKELVSRMIINMIRGAGGNSVKTQLTDLYLSLEAVEDIRAWGASDLDDVTRREILMSNELGMANLYGVSLHPMHEFGIGQDYHTIINSLGGSLPSGTLEWCVGLNLNADMSFVMPVRKELTTREDPTLYRQERFGLYGTMRYGTAVLDSRNIILGAM